MSPTDLPSTPMNAALRPPQKEDDPTRVARLLWLQSVFGDVVNRQASFSLEPLAARMIEFFLPRGASLYEAGTVSDSLFFIVKGAVRQGGEGFTTFRAGDVLGFVDAVSERPHLHSARALEDSVILRLKLDDWLTFLEEHPAALQGLFTANIGNTRPRPDLWGRNPDVLEALLSATEPPGASARFVRRLLAARCSPLLRHASIQALAQLMQPAEVLQSKPGTQISVGRSGLYLVVSGSIWAQIGSRTANEAHVYPPGTVLGSTCLVFGLPEVAEVRAEQASELLFIDREHYFEVMEDHFDLARSSMIYMARKVEESNRERVAEPSPTVPTR